MNEEDKGPNKTDSILYIKEAIEEAEETLHIHNNESVDNDEKEIVNFQINGLMNAVVNHCLVEVRREVLKFVSGIRYQQLMSSASEFISLKEQELQEIERRVKSTVINNVKKSFNDLEKSPITPSFKGSVSFRKVKPLVTPISSLPLAKENIEEKDDLHLSNSSSDNKSSIKTTKVKRIHKLPKEYEDTPKNVPLKAVEKVKPVANPTSSPPQLTDTIEGNDLNSSNDSASSVKSTKAKRRCILPKGSEETQNNVPLRAAVSKQPETLKKKRGRPRKINFYTSTAAEKLDDEVDSTNETKKLKMLSSKLIEKDDPIYLDKPILVDGIRCYYRDFQLAGLIPIIEGCARAQGFTKLSVKEKRLHIKRIDLQEMLPSETSLNIDLKIQQRRLAHEFSASTALKTNPLSFRKKNIKFARSMIHGWGLYALEPICPDEIIIEYVGEKIRAIVADVREEVYESHGIGSSYMFSLEDDLVIDATSKGSFARYINHSCTPNSYAKVSQICGEKKIVLYCKKPIEKFEEITYDYKFGIEDEKLECYCNSRNCRSFMN